MTWRDIDDHCLHNICVYEFLVSCHLIALTLFLVSWRTVHFKLDIIFSELAMYSLSLTL